MRLIEASIACWVDCNICSITPVDLDCFTCQRRIWIHDSARHRQDLALIPCTPTPGCATYTWRVIGAGDGHRHVLTGGAAMAVIDLNRIGRRQRLARRKEVKGFVLCAVVPGNIASTAAGAVRLGERQRARRGQRALLASR